MDLRELREANEQKKTNNILWFVIGCLFIFIVVPLIFQAFVYSHVNKKLDENFLPAEEAIRSDNIRSSGHKSEQEYYDSLVCDYVTMNVKLEGRAGSEMSAQSKISYAQREIDYLFRGKGIKIGEIKVKNQSVVREINPYSPLAVFIYNADLVYKVKPVSKVRPLLPVLKQKKIDARIGNFSLRQVCR